MKQSESSLLADRVILVTGAGDGIGKAAAKAYASHGAQVVLLGRTTTKLEEIYDEILEASGPMAAIYPLNLGGAVPADYYQLATTIEKEMGRLDGVLHNACLLGQITPIEQYNEETWEEVIKVNVTAPFMLTKAIIPLMAKSPDASILFNSCEVGRKSKAYWGAYAVSKFALEGLMQTLACELNNTTEIRVNSFDPGPVRTALRASAYPAEDPSQLTAPEDVLDPLVYLMGPHSTQHNGESLTFNDELLQIIEQNRAIN